MNPAPSVKALAFHRRGGPATRTLVRWTLAVLAVHMGLLLALAGHLDWRLPGPQAIRAGPIQTRWLPPPVQAVPNAQVPAAASTAPARTRVAQVAKALPSLSPAGLEQTETKPAPREEVAAAPVLPASDAQIHATPPPVATLSGTGDQDSAPTTEAAAPASEPAIANSDTPAPAAVAAQASAPSNPASAASERLAMATMDLPSLKLAALPASSLLSYRLNGQEKGIHYTATGELRWQHNDTAYEMSLSIKAFLLGTRHWRSQGQITPSGLAPTKFSDSWRSERAAHFDRKDNRIVFSSNAPTVPLQAGAQDQISLYPQLAAAMAGSEARFKPGTRLQIQTATTRDALPWLLTMDQIETLEIEGQALHTTKWVCQPRNRFDAKVEFWVAAEQGWLPVRIRITQVSGSFIDLNLSSHAPLPTLPSQNQAD